MMFLNTSHSDFSILEFSKAKSKSIDLFINHNKIQALLSDDYDDDINVSGVKRLLANSPRNILSMYLINLTKCLYFNEGRP